MTCACKAHVRYEASGDTMKVVLDRMEWCPLHGAAEDLRRALQLPLLFHGADWDEDKRAIWKSITGHSEATTKIMCDHIRAALKSAEIHHAGETTTEKKTI